MGIATKGQRKIVLNNELYYWSVREDDDSADHILRIVKANDRRVYMSYRLGHHAMFDKQYGFIKCPVWATEQVTPSAVKQIVAWYLSEKDNPILVDYSGKTIPLLTLPDHAVFPIEQFAPDVANFRVFYVKELQQDIIRLILPLGKTWLLDNKRIKPLAQFDDIPLPTTKLADLSEQHISFAPQQVMGTLTFAESEHPISITSLSFKAHQHVNIPTTIAGTIYWHKQDTLLGHFTPTEFKFEITSCYFIRDFDAAGKKIAFIRE